MSKRSSSSRQSDTAVAENTLFALEVHKYMCMECALIRHAFAYVSLLLRVVMLKAQMKAITPDWEVNPILMMR